MPLLYTGKIPAHTEGIGQIRLLCVALKVRQMRVGILDLSLSQEARDLGLHCVLASLISRVARFRNGPVRILLSRMYELYWRRRLQKVA